MQKNQRVSEMASEALERQAEARTKWSGEELEEAFKAVVGTEAGRKLLELRNGAYRDELAEQRQEDLAQKRYEERHRARQERLGRATKEERREAQLSTWKEHK